MEKRLFYWGHHRFEMLPLRSDKLEKNSTKTTMEIESAKRKTRIVSTPSVVALPAMPRSVSGQWNYVCLLLGRSPFDFEFYFVFSNIFSHSSPFLG
jgi:hypothetical protein